MRHPSPDKQRLAFEHLFRETRTDLLAYLMRRACSIDDAADLLSETYLIAWRRLDAIPPGDEARPWLYGVARNLLMKNAGRSRTRNHLAERLAQELRAAPTERSSDEAQSAMLRQALHALPERDRELLTLATWEGLDPRQIAIVVGATPNAVRVRLHRARARLRGQLETPPPSPRSSAVAADGKPPVERFSLPRPT